MPLSRGPATLKELGQVGDQTTLLGDEEGASMDMRDIRSNKYCSFLTILDNVLTVSELAGGQERDSQPHPNPGDLLGGA
jgi:hypothetical protein